MRARLRFPALASFASTRHVSRDSAPLQAAWALDEIDQLRTEIAELQDRADQLATLLDSELTYRDLEMKIRDGTITIHTVNDQDSTVATAQRWLSAMIFHVLLGDEDELPSNYRSWSFEMRAREAGQGQDIALSAEVIKPGGKSSHEIREMIEAALQALPTGEKERVGKGESAEHVWDRCRERAIAIVFCASCGERLPLPGATSCPACNRSDYD